MRALVIMLCLLMVAGCTKPPELTEGDTTMEPRLVVYVGVGPPGNGPLQQPKSPVFAPESEVTVVAEAWQKGVMSKARVKARLVRIRRGGAKRETVATWEPVMEGERARFTGKLPQDPSPRQLYHVEIWRDVDPKPWGFCGLAVEKPEAGGATISLSSWR